LVTDGGKLAAEADATGLRQATPPQVLVARVTGAGDTFMAAHMSAELRGDAPQAALEQALQAAARYVSGETAH
jgi:pseudouridine kinase